jgi:Polyketide cyclase / dehydrase and lipid transport
MSAVVRTPRERVWRALTAPEEVTRWDERLVALAAPAPGYPTEGQPAHWRVRLGRIPLELRARPLEVVPGQRLRSAVALGPFRYEETYVLAAEPGEADATRLTLRIVSSSAVPVVGGVLDRFAVRSLASRRIDVALRALREWCEAHPEPRG